MIETMDVLSSKSFASVCSFVSQNAYVQRRKKVIRTHDTPWARVIGFVAIVVHGNDEFTSIEKFITSDFFSFIVTIIRNMSWCYDVISCCFFFFCPYNERRGQNQILGLSIDEYIYNLAKLNKSFNEKKNFQWKKSVTVCEFRDNLLNIVRLAQQQ